MAPEKNDIKEMGEMLSHIVASMATLATKDDIAAIRAEMATKDDIAMVLNRISGLENVIDMQSDEERKKENLPARVTRIEHHLGFQPQPTQAA